MTAAFPDIEIYLKRIETAAIVAWLENNFKLMSTTKRGKATVCQLAEGTECVITEKVAKGGYSSVWFKENKTPWPTDHACARAAYLHFRAEVRCSKSGWIDDGTEPDDKSQSEPGDVAGWLRITEKGEQTVNWFE